MDHQGLEVLVGGKTDFSFVSDHATLAMALGVGLFVAHRGFGLAAIGLALAEGFARVYLGVHYPTDVIGGLALGTAVALLLAPLALALLTPSSPPSPARAAAPGSSAPGGPRRRSSRRRSRSPSPASAVRPPEPAARTAGPGRLTAGGKPLGETA